MVSNNEVNMRKSLLLSAGALMFGVSMSSSAQDEPEPAVAFSGDVRLGHFARDRDERDGTSSTSSDWRARIRLGLAWEPSETWGVKGRIAGRYSTDDTNEHFEFFTAIPGDEGLRPGDATFDELYVRYRPDPAWEVRLGRMQTKFELEGVAKKSLSRNDSPNTEITWTDGVHARYTGPGGWEYHGILQRSEDDGPTTVRRAPLAFTDSASHVTYYAGMEKKDKEGLFLQRAWDVTYIPEGLHPDGVGAGATEDYLGVTGRLALQWPMRDQMRFVWAGEAGYAPETPTKAALGLPGGGDTDGWAFQSSVNLVDFTPGHSVGVVYGQVDGGWLLSPDFGTNQELLEARYQWRFAPNQSVEARLRGRSDLDQLAGAPDKREDTDWYVRYTASF